MSAGVSPIHGEPRHRQALALRREMAKEEKKREKRDIKTKHSRKETQKGRPSASRRRSA